MINKIVCSIKDGLKKIALLENNDLQELYIFKTDCLTVGDIVVGRITEKNDNIKAFFVNTGKNQNAFLPMTKHNNYSVGDILPFEIIKEGKGNKHPKISSKISLAGAFCVYSPYGEGYSIAKSIKDEQEKERLEYIAMDISPLIEGGITIRSAAVGVDENCIRQEIEFLKSKWEKITSKTDTGLAAKGLDPIIFFLSQHKSSLSEVICDNSDFLSAIKNWGSQVNISSDIFNYFAKNEDLFAHFDIDESIDLLLEKEIHLSGGSKIIIEPTAAFVSIDIDSGSNYNNIFNINMAACEEALKQIRLRNLSGQIIIDLIKDRRNPDLSEKIFHKLQKIANQDSIRTKIIGITPLGNLEITRDRRFASLYEVLK